MLLQACQQMSHNNLNLNDTARIKAMTLRCMHAMDVIKLGIEITNVSVY